MVAIGIAFAFGEVQIPWGSSVVATVGISASRMLQGARFHVWTGLCKAALLMLAIQDRRWLFVLPVPALLHSYYDFVYGFTGAEARAGVQALVLLLLGLARSSSCSGLRRRRPVSTECESRWHCCSVQSRYCSS